MFAIAELIVRASLSPAALPSGTTRLVVKVCVSMICATSGNEASASVTMTSRERIVCIRFACVVGAAKESGGPGGCACGWWLAEPLIECVVLIKNQGYMHR
jgi:hypothetical protein